MKNSRLVAAFVYGGAATALVACSSSESDTPTPNTATGTPTATVAGPVTSTPVTSGTTVTSTTAPGTTGTTGTPTTTGGTPTATVTSTGTTTTGATTGTTATTGGGGASATATTVTATTGAGTCASSAAATAPVPITPADGWVQCNTTDPIGIQGAFYTYGDGTSTITPESFSAAGEEICVTGNVAATATDIWGAGVGFNLNQAEGSDDTNPWNATAAGITGIKFTLSALPAGGLLRLIYASGGADYCVEVTAAGEQTVLFSETTADCWEAGGDPPDVTTLESVKWQVAAVTDSYAFDFCISAVSAVP